ncbi:MAG: hypothetical protein NTZ18_04000 [Candidatus Komeilibacteria bacterium]|nr:hypothetical protein [Candidatus Komeilibacteria bacterium]
MRPKTLIIVLVAAGMIVIAASAVIKNLPIKGDARVAYADADRNEIVRNNEAALLLDESVWISEEKLAVCLDSTNLTDLMFAETPITISAGEIVIYGDVVFSEPRQMFRKIWLVNQRSRRATGHTGLVLSALLRYFPDPNQAWAYQDSCQKALADTGETPNPSLAASLPDSFVYDISQGEVALGLVTEGESFRIVPTLLSDTLIWDRCRCDYCRTHTDGGSKSLRGIVTGRLARTVKERPNDYPAPEAPIGALLIKLPGQTWAILDRPETYQARQNGLVLVSLNDRNGLFSENAGKILLKSSRL